MSCQSVAVVRRVRDWSLRAKAKSAWNSNVAVIRRWPAKQLPGRRRIAFVLSFAPSMSCHADRCHAAPMLTTDTGRCLHLECPLLKPQRSSACLRVMPLSFYFSPRHHFDRYRAILSGSITTPIIKPEGIIARRSRRISLNRESVVCCLGFGSYQPRPRGRGNAKRSDPARCSLPMAGL
jgi:hypothetical protein